MYEKRLVHFYKLHVQDATQGGRQRNLWTEPARHLLYWGECRAYWSGRSHFFNAPKGKQNSTNKITITSLSSRHRVISFIYFILPTCRLIKQTYRQIWIFKKKQNKYFCISRCLNAKLIHAWSFSEVEIYNAWLHSRACKYNLKALWKFICIEKKIAVQFLYI